VVQLLALRPDLEVQPLRGNLDTRLRKLDTGDYDAIVLAAAGLRRLGFMSRISLTVPAEGCVPAPGQGIIAIEIRAGDDTVAKAVAPVNDGAAAAALEAERELVAVLGGGCQTPIGALAVPVGADELELVAVVVALDGTRAVRAGARGLRADARAIGRQAAEELLSKGAGDILTEARKLAG
jgi:hydroxymethylbilane synthase